MDNLWGEFKNTSFNGNKNEILPPWPYSDLLTNFFRKGGSSSAPGPLSIVKDLKGKSEESIVILGGGKTLDYFDFNALEFLKTKYKVTTFGCNGGSIFHPCDVIFVSNLKNARDYKWRCFLEDKEQSALLLWHAMNEVIKNKRFYDAQYSFKNSFKYDVFKTSIQKNILSFSGSDIGMYAIRVALMLKPKNIFLTGFDGRREITSGNDRRFIEGNWAGPVEITNPDYTIPKRTAEQMTHLFNTRNKENISSFELIMRYCDENSINLKWITPSIYISDKKMQKKYYFWD